MKNKIAKLSLALATSCLMIGSVNAAQATTEFGVRANILGTCTITAEDLDFGTVQLSNVNRATNIISLDCPPEIPVYINLGPGQHAESGVDQVRSMLQTVGTNDHLVAYKLYTDSSYNTEYELFPDGLRGGLELTTDSTGNQVTVYGEMPVQELKPAGVYTDRVNVLVTY